MELPLLFVKDMHIYLAYSFKFLERHMCNQVVPEAMQVLLERKAALAFDYILSC